MRFDGDWNRRNAYSTVLDGEVQQKATQAAAQLSDELEQNSAYHFDTAKQGLGKLGQFGIDALAAGTQLASALAANQIVPGGAILLNGLNAFGSETKNARQKGADLGQQLAAGVGNAALSLGTEKLFNVAPSMKSTYGEGLLDSPLADALEAAYKSSVGRMGISALTEGGEEFAQALAQPLLQRIIYDPDAEIDLGDAFYQGFVGAAVGGAADGVDVVISSPTDAAFLSGFLGEEIENGLIELPELPMQNLETEVYFDHAESVFDSQNLEKLLEDSLGDHGKSYSFDPERAKSSLTDALDVSKGLEDNIAMLRYYAESTDYVLSEKMPSSIAYDSKNDVIRYNPNFSLPGNVDIEGILAHELAHRGDCLMYDVKNNVQWQSTIENLTQSVISRGKEIESLFLNDEKYADPYLSDIMSAIFYGSIEFPYGHDEDYWSKPGRREEEIFANICAMDTLYSLETQEFYSLIEPLYTIWKKIMKG